MKRAWLAVPLAALLLSSCAAQRSPPLAASGADELPPIASDLPPLPAQAMQTLHAAFAEREESLQCGIGTANGGWRAVCVNPLGMRLLSLGVAADGQVTAERGLGVPEQLDPRRILADVQLAYWPLASLSAAYAGSPWRVSEPLSGTRRLWRDGRLAAEIHYADKDPWNGRLWLVNLRYGYTLAIRTETAPAP